MRSHSFRKFVYSFGILPQLFGTPAIHRFFGMKLIFRALLKFQDLPPAADFFSQTSNHYSRFEPQQARKQFLDAMVLYQKAAVRRANTADSFDLFLHSPPVDIDPLLRPAQFVV